MSTRPAAGWAARISPPLWGHCSSRPAPSLRDVPQRQRTSTNLQGIHISNAKRRSDRAGHRSRVRSGEHADGSALGGANPRQATAWTAHPLCRGSELGSHAMTYLVAANLPTAPAGERFRALLDRSGILQMPGAHNGMAALQAKAAGFEALYLSGAAMTASMGIPDLGMITVDEVCFFIRQIARATGLPLLVDRSE